MELVDLPPDDLIQRLREGRSTSRSRPSAPSNISSPREPYRSARAGAAPRRPRGRGRPRLPPRARMWSVAGTERLLVCIDEGRCGALIRAARRLAERLLQWIVGYVENPDARAYRGEEGTLGAFGWWNSSEGRRPPSRRHGSEPGLALCPRPQRGPHRRGKRVPLAGRLWSPGDRSCSIAA